MVEYVIEIVEKGGIVLVPILLVSIYAWYLIIIKWIQLKKEQFPYNSNEIKDVLTVFSSGNSNAYQLLSKKYSGIYIQSIGILHENIGSSEKSITHKLEQLFLETWPSIEDGFGTIAVLANIAPLLGLLGTVSGMIHTFKTITLFGSGNPALMAGGISEALLTTQSGLLVSFPILLCLTFLQNRINRLKNSIESSVRGLLNYKASI